jgi:release factor glutamine methyltransferase
MARETQTLRDLIEAGRDWLTAKGIDNARLDTELLIAHAFGESRLALYLDLDRPVHEEEKARARELFKRRGAREPLAYITGEREFYGRPFAVSPAVLIPRPDTETLVDAALEKIAEDATGTVVDVGTGSGCVAISLALERPGLRVIGTDVSGAALAVAAKNVEAHDLGERVELREGDLLGPVDEEPLLIVGNPPYIASGTELMPEVGEHEPALALFGEDADALGHHRRVLERAGALGAPAVLLEIGFDQGDAVRALTVGDYGAAAVVRDLAGHPRVAVWTRTG